MGSPEKSLKPVAATLVLLILITALGIASLTLSAYTYTIVVKPSNSSVPIPVVPERGEESQKPQINCTVLIIGSGFAGSYAAYQLAPQFKDQLCLVEQLDRDGGRIHDVSEYPGGPVFGAGALRVTQSQPTMLALATELEIELQMVQNDEELAKVRGQYFYPNSPTAVNQMCEKVFPTINCTAEEKSSVNQGMYVRLDKFRRENPHLFHSFADYPTLVAAHFGAEGLEFMRENSRHSLFSSIAGHGMMDWLVTQAWGALSYPVGGMSQYIQRMLKKAAEHGPRLYRSEPVVEMTADYNGRFTVETRNYFINAERVLCSIDPTGFKSITGNVAEVVKASPEFRGISPKAAVTVAAWWNERWWETSSLHGEHKLSLVQSRGDCFNRLEIATYPYGSAQNVTRAVYDDGACIHMWRTIIASGNVDQLVTEVVRSLQQVFDDVQVPRPRMVYGEVHENAWHFQEPSSTKTNQDVFSWSGKPTAYSNFALVGEAYNLNYAAWADAALKSVMTVLTNQYGFTYPCLDDPGSPAVCPMDASQSQSLLRPRRKYLGLP